MHYSSKLDRADCLGLLTGKLHTGTACLQQVLSPNLELGGRLNPEPIIHGLPEPLPASQIFLRGLHLAARTATEKGE